MELDIILKILLAAMLGGIIGLERELSHKEAGLRTNILIAIGSALITILSFKIAAMSKTTVDSPRGKFTLSASHNPVQDMFLREAVGKNNEYKGVAVKALADPGRGCKM